MNEREDPAESTERAQLRPALPEAAPPQAAGRRTPPPEEDTAPEPADESERRDWDLPA